jgi:hypothetical protein
MYELMERTTGSLVGTYPSEDMALLAVLETVSLSGEQAIATIALGVDDPSGVADGQLIAEGPALVEMARTRHHFARGLTRAE